MAIHSVAEFIRSCWRSRLARVLVCIHAAWFFLAIANMSAPSFAHFLDGVTRSSATMFAGRPFHFHYESTSLRLLIIVDSPSALVEGPFGLVSYPLPKTIHFNTYLAGYFGAGLLLLTATCQWFVIGNRVENWLVAKHSGRWFVRMLTRYSAAIIVLILLLAVVFVPIINRRSQTLCFQRSAIFCR